jgi:homoserine O-acetyltransferase
MPVATLTTERSRSLITRPTGAPVVVVLGGISASRDARNWWPAIVGHKRAVDTRGFRVLGIDWLDGGEGRDGRPLRAISTHDQADALAAVLDEHEVQSLHAIVGASYGGMVALAFADRYPTRVEHVVAISAPARAHPMSTALRSIQRRIVELGLETGRGRDAMAIARGLAMTTYRSAEEFGERFEAGREPKADNAVEGYLRHHGEKFAAVMSPARFLALSLSADSHCIDPTRIATRATFVAARGDTIVPIAQMDDLAARWAGSSRLIELPARTGHDAFLAEPELIGPVLYDSLNEPALT